MKNNELADLLRNMKVETGSLMCLGCGHEHNCGIHGCAVLSMAADALGNSERHVAALQKEIEGLRAQLNLQRCTLCDYWDEADPRCMCGKSPWGGKTTQKDNYCSHWERHADWIPVTERLPEDDICVLVLASGRPLSNVLLDRCQEIAEHSDDGWIIAEWPEWKNPAITHWMPLPEPPEVKM